MKKHLIALAGQPNGGKSTVFNSLTGAKQLVANYPGVTVDKMTGWYRNGDNRYEVVDLPGTYSMTSYSPEERVTRDFLLDEGPDVVVNVVDAANLKRCFYLTLQLLEMRVPLVIDLNMMDIAEKQGLTIDVPGLSKALGVPVVGTSIRTGRGRKELLEQIDKVAALDGRPKVFLPEYPALKEQIAVLARSISEEENLDDQYPATWLAVKLLENDAGILATLRKALPGTNAILVCAAEMRRKFEEAQGQTVDMYIASQRYRTASGIADKFVRRTNEGAASFSDRLDRVVCGKVTGPLILLGVIYLLYRLSIVEGYRLTNYTWPILAWVRATIESFLPVSGFISVPVIREFVLWCVDSINALLNYIPIFLILFGLIAILEDSGYMPRMAFIMDRLLSRFGLHGQSTLSMVLSGVVVGGCVVPGVMSTKGIPDERSRLATLLTLPLLNCLAKVPLYILLINIYFADQKALSMFFISTISLLFVLPVAKLLTMTVLRDKPTAPFIMEMPPYHLPTVRGVVGRAIERVWLYIRKITTVVAAVAVVLFALLQFPGVDAESMGAFETRKENAIASFLRKIDGNAYAEKLGSESDILSLILYQEDYRAARRTARGDMESINGLFEERNPAFFRITTDKSDKDGQTVDRALKGVVSERRNILAEIREKRIENSILGRTGRALEPVSKYAGFNWKVNVSILSALAAKESTVATLGALYQPEEAGEDAAASAAAESSLETRMATQETGFTSLHALALMLFMVLCPPCFPTTIAIKVQTGSFSWMLFSFLYPLALGLVTATLVFSGGTLLGLSGEQAMWAFYLVPLALTLIAGILGNPGQERIEAIEPELACPRGGER